jgi:dipeptidyl aminopeptidase/acylaminoacyl peptidase
MSLSRKLLACALALPLLAQALAPRSTRAAHAPRLPQSSQSRQSPTAAPSATAAPRPYFYEPALSPDAAEIAFVSGGDVWSVAAGGGEARLLVSHPAAESRPLYSPDGASLAFTSARTGNGDLYVLSIATARAASISTTSRRELRRG